jgi:hypothetical protein
MKYNFGVIIPMANEEKDFHPFVDLLTDVLNMLECGKIYFIVDKVSKDNTLKLCEDFSMVDGRFINGGSINDSSIKRVFLSKAGTILSNILLGTKMYDMTSGFQGFHASIVKKFLAYNLLSKAHFYQTELRYLLRKTRYAEIPIHYRAPSPGAYSFTRTVKYRRDDG